jgi:Rieske Fe-S protein
MRRPSRLDAIRMMLGVGGSFLFGATAVDAEANVGPGKPCKKVGRRRTVGKRTFECSRVKGELRWKRIPSIPEPVYVRAIDSSALRTDTSQVVTAKDASGRSYTFVVTRSAAGVFALSSACTHAGCPVFRSGPSLYCDCHGSRFDAESGSVLDGPATRSLAKFPVIERDGAVLVRVR